MSALGVASCVCELPLFLKVRWAMVFKTAEILVFVEGAIS